MFEDLKILLIKKCDITNISIEQHCGEIVIEFVPTYAVKDLKPNERFIYVSRLSFQLNPTLLYYICTDYGVSYRIVKSVESVVKKYFKSKN